MRLISFAAVAAAMFAITPAFAQVVRLPDTPLIFLPLITGESTASTTGANQSILTAPDRPIGAASALSQFSLGFENGDHKIRRLQVLAEGEMARLAINDIDGTDPFAGQARWVNFGGAVQAHSVSSTRGGGRIVTQLPIPAGPANHTFALRGFEIRRAERTDANVRNLAIGLASSGTAIEVIFSDNEGVDLRLNQARVAGRTGPNIGRRYSVTVQYMWVPNNLVASVGAITGNQNGREAAAIPPGRAVIRGFSFEFLNTDHHLLQVRVDTANGGAVTYQDNNTDDPVRWRVDYAALR